MRDYWPDDLGYRRATIFNKTVYVFLFLFAWLILGIIFGVKSTIIKDLNDPYVNSIPANALAVENLDTVVLNSFLEGLSFDKIFDLSYSKVIRPVDNQSILFSGIGISADHPYFNIIFDSEQLIWKHDEIESISLTDGVILSEEGLKKLSQLDSLSFPPILNSVHFIELDINKIDKNAHILAVCKSLPTNKDFILYDSFSLDLNTNTNSREDTRSIWEVEIDKEHYEIEILERHRTFIDKVLKEKSPGSTSVVFDSDQLPGKLVIKTTEEINERSFSQLITEINRELLQKSEYEGDTITIQKTGKERSIQLKDVEEYKKWTYFTFTSDNIKKDSIYSLITQLLDLYPSLIIDTKSVDIVFTTAKLEKRVNRLEFIILVFVLLAGIALNSFILKVHILRRKDHLGYLKTIGVKRRNLILIYCLEGCIETLVAFLASFVIVLMFKYILQVLPSNFILPITDMLVFMLIMLFLSMITYSLQIHVLLKQNFRVIVNRK